MRVVARFSEVLGQVAIKRRLERKLTQAAAANEMGMLPSSLCRLERGTGSFTITQLRIAARLYQTTVGALVLHAEAAAEVLAKKGVVMLDQDPEEDGLVTWISPREIKSAVVGVRLARPSVVPTWKDSLKQKDKAKVTVGVAERGGA